MACGPALLLLCFFAQALGFDLASNPTFLAKMKADLRDIECPCSNKTLCLPVTTNYDKELVGFTANVPASLYKKFDWSQVCLFCCCLTN